MAFVNVGRATVVLAVAFATMQVKSSIALPSTGITDQANENECGVLEAVLVDHFHIKGRSNLPLRTTISSAEPISQADWESQSFAVTRYKKLLARLEQTQRVELESALRAGSSHSYKIACHWKSISIPAEPPPQHRWCVSFDAYMTAQILAPKPSNSPGEIARQEAEMKAEAQRTCPFPGGISLSRPLLTSDGKWALVEVGVQRMPLDGEGSVCLLNKDVAGWKAVECDVSWVS